MGVVRGVGFVLILYGYLSLSLVRKGSDHLVTREGRLLGALTKVGIYITFLMMALGVVSRTLFCSGGRKWTERVNSMRSILIPLVLPLEVMVGYCYLSNVLHSLQAIEDAGMRCGEMVFSVFTGLCQHMAPVLVLMSETHNTTVRRSSMYIVGFLLFGGWTYFYMWSHPGYADIYSPCCRLNKLGSYGRAISYSKVVIIPIITYELMTRIQHRRIVSTRSAEKIKPS